MKYLLDANTYIQAKNQYYGMDFCPAYWDWLDQQFQVGTVASIKMVADELKTGKDELATWVKNHNEHFIDTSDDASQEQFGKIASLVVERDYKPQNRDNFLAGADPWLIAKASVTDATVVTLESRKGPGTKSVKLPNICQDFDVPCISSHELLRTLKAKFILGK